MKKKLIIVSVALVLVVCFAVGMTIAYLKATAPTPVKNTFTVGNITMKLDEAKVNTDGTPVENADRVTENEYHLLPACTYTKDPTVTINEGSEECYVRMRVYFEAKEDAPDTFVLADALAVLFGNGGLPQDYCNWDPNGKWEVYSYDTTTHALEFRYTEKVDALSAEQVLDPLFTTITVPGAISNENLAKLAGLQIRIEADAIQTAGFADAAAAWAAFNPNP